MEALKDWLGQRGLATEYVEIVSVLIGAGLLLLAAMVRMEGNLTSGSSTMMDRGSGAVPGRFKLPTFFS